MVRIQKPIAVICVCFLNYFLIQKQCFMMLSHFGFMFLLKRSEVTFSPLLDISQKKKILLLITIYRASWCCQPIWARDMGNSVSKFLKFFILKNELCLFIYFGYEMFFQWLTYHMASVDKKEFLVHPNGHSVILDWSVTDHIGKISL